MRIEERIATRIETKPPRNQTMVGQNRIVNARTGQEYGWLWEAISSLRDGDTLIVHSGVYEVEGNQTGTEYNFINIAIAEETNGSYVLQAAGDGQVTITSRTAPSSGEWISHNASRRAFVVSKNSSAFPRPSISFLGSAGSEFVFDCQHLRVNNNPMSKALDCNYWQAITCEHCIFHDDGGFGEIAVQGGPITELTFRNCRFRGFGPTYACLGAATHHQIYVVNSDGALPSILTIEDCVFEPFSTNYPDPEPCAPEFGFHVKSNLSRTFIKDSEFQPGAETSAIAVSRGGHMRLDNVDITVTGPNANAQAVRWGDNPPLYNFPDHRVETVNNARITNARGDAPGGSYGIRCYQAPDSCSRDDTILNFNTEVETLGTTCAGGVYTGVIVSAGEIQHMPPQTWAYVPNSDANQVERKKETYPDWDGSKSDLYNGLSGTSGGRYPAVVSAWNCGAYDYVKDHLYIWGGGHNGYGGNELVRFKLPQMQWERVLGPSLNYQHNVAVYSDGTPSTYHTYDSMLYCPTIGAEGSICIFMGNAHWMNPGASMVSVVNWVFDIATEQWILHDTDAIGHSYCNAAYSEYNDKIYVVPNGGFAGQNFYELTPDPWSFINRKDPSTGSGRSRHQSSLVMDEASGVLHAIGYGDHQTWDTTLVGTVPRVVFVPSGDSAIYTSLNKGVAYRSADHSIYGWPHDGNVGNLRTTVYRYDAVAQNWIAIPASPSNLYTPKHDTVYGTANGVWKRFAYSKTYDCFILCTETGGNIQIYKP